MSDPIASVIVPTYQDWDNLTECLKALQQQVLDAEAFEIIVANNNRTEALPDGLDLPPNARVVWQAKPGSYAARNLAIGSARGQFLFFTDSDCRPEPDWLSNGVALLQSRTELSRIAGRVRTEPASGYWKSWSVYDAIFRLRQDLYAAKGLAVTANLVTRAELFDSVGLFSEKAFSGGDLEWNRRATAAGHEIEYAEQVCVRHDARDSFEENAQKVRRIAGARFRAKEGRPVAQRLPRLTYLFPSAKSAARVFASRGRFPWHLLIAAFVCDYLLGWVYNLEILRLGLNKGSPSRT